MIFADASALIALIADEPDAHLLLGPIRNDLGRLCSAMSVWETVAGLCRSYTYPVLTARTATRSFLGRLRFDLVSIGQQESDIAFEAYRRYGRGRHPANLNMGDCFAYACARSNGAVLLYKGNDFAKTDLA